MKKAILTLGLFSMIMVLTSFTVSSDSSETGDVYVFTQGYDNGGVKVPGDGGKKKDNPYTFNGGVKVPGDGGKKKDNPYTFNGGVKVPGDGGKKKDDI